MKTAEEFFRDKIRELEPNKAVIALRHEIVNAEQAMRWAHEFKELHFAEFSSQDKWVSVETPPKEHGKLYLCYQPIDAEDFKFIILWFDKMTSKFRGWSDEFENRDEDGDFRSVTHWQELPALPSPPKTK